MLGQEDFLRVQGLRLVNRRGKQVALRGTNLGGWLLREGWMDGAGAYEQSVASSQTADAPICLDLGERRRWNRLRVSGAQGDFLVFAGDTPDAMACVGQGSTRSVRPTVLCTGRPVPYVLGGNPYNEGCFFDGEAIHVNEQRTRFIRVEGLNGAGVSVSYFGDADDFTVRAQLRRRFGEKRARELLDAYQRAYITERDLDALRDMGFNLLRVPIYWEQLMDPAGQLYEDGWERLDWVIEGCAARNMYVIPDLHGLPGGQSGGILACGRRDANAFWSDAACQERAIALLRAMARRYRDVPAVAAYDLMNEPLPIGLDEARAEYKHGERYHLPQWIGQRIAEMFDRMLRAVREVDPEHIASISMFIDNDVLKAPRAYGWENVIYQTHTYGYGDWRSEQAMMEAADAALEQHRALLKRWQVPIRSGESNFWESTRVLERWLGGLNEMGISWATWTYKNTDPQLRDHWGIRYAFDGMYPDCERDNDALILEKYECFTSDHYRLNERLASALTSLATR